MFGLIILGLETAPVLAEETKRRDRQPAERVEPFYGSYSLDLPIQVPGFRGIAPRLALSYLSSRRNGPVGVGWRLDGISAIEAAAPRRGTPKYDSNDIFLLSKQELVVCDAAMASPSCTTGGSHATKIESYLRIKQDSLNNLWEVWNREGIKLTYRPVLGPDTLSFGGTFRWALSEVADRHGNLVTYSYWTGTDEARIDTITYNGTEIAFLWELRPGEFDYAIGGTELARTANRL